MSFLTPLGALVGAAALLPLAGALLRERRLRGARRLLGLPEPGRRVFSTAAAGALAVALLALAAARPELSRAGETQVRTDAEAYVVLDNSRSMAAAAARGAPTRFERARALALRLRDALASVPWGVASLNDRLLPHTFPTADRALFAATLDQSVGLGDPAPSFRERNATMLAAVGSAEDFFARRARHRLFVVFTDGESQPFRASALASQLAKRHERLVVVRLWAANERVFDAHGRELGYRPDPASTQQLAALAPAGIPVLPAAAPARVEATVRRLLGNGPTAARRGDPRTLELAPGLVLAAILPLGFALARSRR